MPILVLVLFAGMKLRGGEPAPLAPFEPIGADLLAIEVADRIGVGESIPVTVSGVDGEAQVELIVDTTYGIRRFEAVANAGAATFEIPAIDVPAVGLLTLTAIAGDSTGHGIIELVAGEAVDPLEILLGPRTIEATGGTTATMVVVIPQDSIGNPVSDQTPVEVAVTRPNLRVQRFVIETERLIAWSRIASSTSSGRTRVGVIVDDAGGKEFEFLEIAGTPVEFDVFAVDSLPLADGRSVVRVRTSQLRDEFGNVLPDGINVFADVSGPGGLRRLSAQTINGEAEFAIEVPSLPGTETVVVNASGRLSDPYELEFLAMVGTFDIEARTHPDGILLRVGPVISELQAYIPDGTPVVAAFGDDRREVPSFEGIAEIIVPATSEPITVSILGAERTVEVGP